MIIMHDYIPEHVLAFADGGLPELMAWLESTPAKFTDGGPRDNHPDDFNGYSTWQEVVEMTKNGWAEGAARINNGLPTPPFFPKESRRPHWAFAQAGSLPDIGRYLGGDPNHMRTRKTDKGRKPIVVLYVGMGVRATVSTKEFTNFGTAVCEIIDALEHAGTRVELNQLTRATAGFGRQGHIVTGWRVKEAHDVLDMSAIAFTYMHPAAHRRLQFQMRARFIGSTGGSTSVTAEHFPDAPANAIVLPGISEAAGQCKTIAEAREFLRKRINIAAGEELISKDMIEHLN